jgi:NADH-quinone oxidoreductase subunit E
MVMLSREEIAEIQEHLEAYERKQAASIEALSIVQRHRGWVSDDNLSEVADLLEMSVDELDGIATFYSLIYRRPVGRHVVHFCDSVSCWHMGHEELIERFRSRFDAGLGETSPDGRFTCLSIPCLGACDHAPALMIDWHLHTDVDAEHLERILEEYE